MKNIKTIKRHGEQKKNNNYLTRDSEKIKNTGDTMADNFPK